jgi:hypothetical protein
MDPDAALARLRELLAPAAVDALGDDETSAVLDEVCDLFDGLDNWISKGGVLPKAWAR